MLNNLRSDYTDLQTKYAELTDESKVNTAVSDTTVAELKAEIQRLHDILSNTQDECNSKQKTINQLSEELGKTREICEQKAHKIQELETALDKTIADLKESDRISKVHSYNFEKVNNECALWKQRYQELNNANERECCGYSDQLVDYYRHELNRRAVKLNEREYEYTAVVKNLEKVNAECETWKQRYQELNKKFDNNAVKFTDAKLKADAIAMSYDELSETLHAVEQERDQYKEKYEVTKKLLDAETSAEHTGSDSYNELYKENQQLYVALDKKEEQIDGLFKEAKLLTETKVSLVNELLDLKYLIHKLRLDDETPEEKH